MAKTVCIHLAEGFEEIEAITIIDVLRRANIHTTTVSVTGHKQVTGSHNITVLADKLFEDIDYSEVAMIVLPGGMPGARNLDTHSGLQKQILKFNEEGRPLAAICAAPMVLGKLGILEGEQAVCYPGYEEYLKGASILSEPATESNHVITGRGVGAALKFSLLIVEKLVSKEKAQTLAKQMLVE